MTDSKKPLNQTDLLVRPNNGLDQSGSGQGQALVNAVMNLESHKMREISWVA